MVENSLSIPRRDLMVNRLVNQGLADTEVGSNLMMSDIKQRVFQILPWMSHKSLNFILDISSYMNHEEINSHFIFKFDQKSLKVSYFLFNIAKEANRMFTIQV